MQTTIPKPCLRLLQQMDENYGCGYIEDLYADRDAFCYCQQHGHIKRVMPGTYVLTEKAKSLIVQQRLCLREELDELLQPLVERKKHPTPKRTARPASARPPIGATDHDRSLVYTAAGWVDARSPIILEAIDRLTKHKGTWLTGWSCLGDDPRTQRRFDKIRKAEPMKIVAHIESGRKGYRWVDQPSA